jgi:hypothetical protein
MVLLQGAGGGDGGAILPTTGVLAAKYEVGNNVILWLLLFSGFANLV